ncbi:DUF2599 domain-containing protein [Amycolatopsis sp. NPDC059657]|uniref:DUF2599 domain-containing protein n=1 Tax=Amycolatopsis sp. NPDC059657 TaxID=3346899 RepID=UPI00366EB05F
MIRSLTVLTVTVSAMVLAAPAYAATSDDDIRTARVDRAAVARLQAAPDLKQAIIDHTAWLTDPKGPRLAVFPTEYGRTSAPASAWASAWNEVVALAPSANQQNMKDQFRCHYDFARATAPDKPSWNLEQWRPDVGYLATVLAQCNPS